jgi:hypothetical protein
MVSFQCVLQQKQCPERCNAFKRSNVGCLLLPEWIVRVLPAYFLVPHRPPTSASCLKKCLTQRGFEAWTKGAVFLLHKALKAYHVTCQETRNHRWSPVWHEEVRTEKRKFHPRGRREPRIVPFKALDTSGHCFQCLPQHAARHCCDSLHACMMTCKNILCT